MTATVSRRRAVRINLAVNGLSIALMLVQGIVLVPLYLRELGTDLYGSWLATGNVLAWLSMVDPGVSAVVQQQVADASGARDLARLKRIIGGSLLLGVAQFAVVGGAGLAAAPWVTRLVHLPGSLGAELVHAFAGMAVVNGAMLGYFALSAILIGRQLSLSIGVINVGATALGIAVTVWGLLAGLRLDALWIGRGVTAVLLIVGNLALLYGRELRHLAIRPEWRLRHARELLRTLRYTFASRLGWTIAGNLDALLVNSFLGPSEVVVLNITRKAGEVAGMALDRVGATFMPALAHALGDGKAATFRDVTTRLTRLFAATVALVVVGVVGFNRSFVTLWVGPQHFGGIALSTVLALASAAGMLNALLASVVFAAGQVRFVSVVTTVEAATRLGLLLALLAAGAGLLSVPVSALVAAAAVTGAAFARRVRTLVGTTGWFPIVRTYAVPLAVLAAVALVLAWRPAHQTWPGFWTAVIATEGLCAGVLVVFTPLRDELQRLLRWRPGRHVPQANEGPP